MVENGETLGLLTNRAQQTKNARLKQLAFFLAILSCLSAASVALFSVYAPTLQHLKGYSQIEINAISTAMITFNYLPVPVIGYLGDKYGEKNLALLGGLFVIPGYFSAAYFIKGEGMDYRYLAVSFAAIGGGLASFFFAGLVSCARLYPQSAGLSISAPIASFGLSALWEAQAVRRFFGKKNGAYVNLHATFLFFGVLYIITTTTCYIAARLSDRNTKLVEREGLNKTANEGEDEDIDDDAEFGGLNQRQRLIKVLKSVDFWLFAVCFVISSGPLEMYLNNMGAIIDTIPMGPDVSTHVSMFAAASTGARLIGGLSDALRHRISRPVQFATVMASVGVCHFLLASGIFASNKGSIFYISSLVNGFAYGVTFTMVPTIVACVWGVKSFGTNWGVLLLAPAMGVNIYGSIFARLYELASNSKLITSPLPGSERDALIQNGSCDKSYLCYQQTFIITGSGFIICALLIIGLWRNIWRYKGRNL